MSFPSIRSQNQLTNEFGRCQKLYNTQNNKKGEYNIGSFSTRENNNGLLDAIIVF